MPCKLRVQYPGTTLVLKAIAARVHLGTSRGVKTNLPKWLRARASKKTDAFHCLINEPFYG